MRVPLVVADIQPDVEDVSKIKPAHFRQRVARPDKNR